MKKQVILTILFDYYGELLTLKQRNYFKDYYFENYSLSEIAENYGISRNAVHKQLKIIEEKLMYYESVLALSEKSKVLDKLADKINDENLKKQIKDIL